MPLRLDVQPLGRHDGGQQRATVLETAMTAAASRSTLRTPRDAAAQAQVLVHIGAVHGDHEGHPEGGGELRCRRAVGQRLVRVHEVEAPDSSGRQRRRT